VTCAEESAAPRSDCSPTDELIRDQRSVVSTAQSIHTYIRLRLRHIKCLALQAVWFTIWTVLSVTFILHVWCPVSIQTQSLALHALRALRKRKPQETQALALASSQSWLPLLRPSIPIGWRLRLLRENFTQQTQTGLNGNRALLCTDKCVIRGFLDIEWTVLSTVVTCSIGDWCLFSAKTYDYEYVSHWSVKKVTQVIQYNKLVISWFKCHLFDFKSLVTISCLSCICFSFRRHVTYVWINLMSESYRLATGMLLVFF